MIPNAAKKMLLAGGSPRGQVAFTTSGVTSWTVPQGVYLISFVLVASGWLAGGGLSWFNDVPVKPGDVVRVEVSGEPRNGVTNTVLTINGHTYQANSPTNQYVGGLGKGINSSGAPFRNKGGGDGGRINPTTTNASGGGGAGGYSGNGGEGTNATSRTAAHSGTGGGGGGGTSNGTNGGGGGGVGLLGEGASGGAASGTINGAGGSGGQSGYANSGLFRGGDFGGGGGTEGSTRKRGGYGAARIIYGQNRAFPATNTGDVA